MNYHVDEGMPLGVYDAPRAESVVILSEISILTISGGNNDDNEHTEEEDLF